MLARGPILTISQRQTLASPCTHSLEVVGAGTNINYLIPVSGLLQEVRIRLGRPVPFYLDSLSTVYVATSDASAKKSAWVLRRIVVLTEAVEMGEIEPLHINDPDMVADAMTKYLTYAVWIFHTTYLMNIPTF